MLNLIDYKSNILDKMNEITKDNFEIFYKDILNVMKKADFIGKIYDFRRIKNGWFKRRLNNQKKG